MSTESQDIHKLQLDMVEMKGDVKLINKTLESQKLQQEKTSKSQEDLTTAINQLINTLAEENGRKEGVRTTIKIIWGTIGSLIIALIIAGSTLIVNMKSELEVLQSELIHLKKDN